MLKRMVTMIAVGGVMGVCAGTQDQSVQIQKTLDTILSKTGISIGGEFKSQYFGAEIGGEGHDSTRRTNESNEFTSVDFDIKARPNDNVTGRVVFRMHQNWQNFFSDVSNPIFTRWLSIDGGALDLFRFNVGDYRAQYSPLTLYTPEIDVMYEPYIFARQRELAMEESFIGNNDRILQGVNFGFDAEIAPLFDEFHYSLSAARLRTNETSIQNGSFIANLWESSRPFSNYFVGNNLGLTFLKGITLEGSLLTLFDHKGSYHQSSLNDTVFADTAAQFTTILSGRPQVDIAKFLGNDALTLKIGAEVAASLDDSVWFDDSGRVIHTVDSLGAPDTLYQGLFPDTTLLGKAIRLNVSAGFSPGDLWNIGLDAAYIMNDHLFRNELAQSPSFLPARIMNLENDAANDSLRHYTTFDALYHSVFKFTPMALTNRWAKAPFRKNSWTRTIYNQRELGMLLGNAGIDPSIELVMPFGPATPNRQGITADLKGSALKGAIEVKGLVSMLGEKDLDTVVRLPDSARLEVPATKFSQMGGGLKVDVSKFFRGLLPYPLELSGSMVLSSAINDGIADTLAMSPKWEITSRFINAGLYWKFFKRAALVGGVQVISNRLTIDTASADQVQMHWAGGIEWKVSQGAEVVMSYGQIRVDNDETNPAMLRAAGAAPTGKDFTQDLVDVSLRVRF
ncbi:MAG: hypothetical protein JXA71_04130 [Chitinispirillaceae bacterium]|nr:hypothetical protein [Chitinispirillaceae bacterium]